ncbi:hypothetical protein ACGFK1_08830 [Mycobacterium sp. NPDC048908]
MTSPVSDRYQAVELVEQRYAGANTGRGPSKALSRNTENHRSFD